MKQLFSNLNWKCFFMSFLAIGAVFTLYAIIFGIGSSDTQTKQSSETETTTFTTGGGTTYTYQTLEGDPGSENKVLHISIKGLILTERISDVGFFDLLGQTGFTYGYDIRETLFRAAENNDIKAVMIEINSPGGTIGGSKAIGEGIEYYKRETGNPVYSHIVDQGTSGGYWAAAATDNITAEVGSIVGSIGVIMGPFRTYNNVLGEGNFGGSVQTENGIDYRFFTGGQYKDTGSPYREMTEEEEEHWQESINNEYDIFVAYVSQARDISINTLRNEIRALPYGNKKAQALGLIDNIGSNKDSFYRLLQTAGIPETDFELISEEEDFGFFESLFEAVKQFNKPEVVQTCQWCNRPLFLYDTSFEVLQSR